MRFKINDDNEVEFYDKGVSKKDLVVVLNDTGELKSLINTKEFRGDSERNLLIIDGEEYPIDSIEIKTISDVSDMYIKTSTLYLKSVEDCLPDPDLFSSVIIRSALKAMLESKPICLTHSQHDRKKSIIRELNKYKVGSGNSGSPSVARIEELLSYYSLDLSSIIKKKYL